MGITITGGVSVLQGLITVKPVVAPPSLSGELWAWGRNNSGYLGLGDTFNRSSPVQIGSLTDWTKVDSGDFHTHAIKTDGSLWSWGRGLDGAHGLGNTTDYSSPVQVGILTNWADVAAADVGRHSLAIKTDGTLWAWGAGGGGIHNGEVGDGTTIKRSSPVQIGALTDWASIGIGSFHSMAIKTNGSLWAWGKNDYGNLGLGNTTYYSSPVQVGSLTDWASVSGGNQHTIALKTDGTMWSWGSNFSGRLGLGDGGAGTERSSPVQIGSLTTWSQVSSGSSTGNAIKTDGTIWSWGGNFNGSLGLGDGGAGTDRSSPVQIGALTNWASVSTGGLHSNVLKTDGALWAFGYNGFGALGDGFGTGNNRSSPVQIGSLTTWISINSGRRQSFAIKTTV